MKQITTDNFSFEKLRSGDALYVDKTQYVWSLVSSETSVYFLSRPRRFGKSLLLSTLKAFFLNRRELFRGLAIDTLAPDGVWQEWPVIHLDMAQASSFDGLEGQKKALWSYISFVAESWGMQASKEDLPSDILNRLIAKLNEESGKQVVVLIDEYDKPILDAFGRPYVEDSVGMMQTFYQVLKSNVEKERFVFLTGVSKFAHTSLFSGFNNPTDISQRPEYAAMLGYTERELRDNFSEQIALAAKAMETDPESLIRMMGEWYDGFRFTASPSHVYNPVSVGKFLQYNTFDNYWYATGTPTFLVKQMRGNPFQLDEYTQDWYELSEYGKSEVMDLNPMEIAIQTGYLTIKDVRRGFGTLVRYGIPNREIRQSWYRNMLPLAYSDKMELNRCRTRFWDSFQKGNVAVLMQQLQWLFAGVTKENIGEVREGYYRNMMYMLFTAFGVSAHSEEQVAGGRVDLVAQAVGQSYVFELKVSRTGDEADVQRLLGEGADQASRKRYADKYRFSGDKVHVVSVVFEHKDHQLVAWREEADEAVCTDER